MESSLLQIISCFQVSSHLFHCDHASPRNGVESLFEWAGPSETISKVRSPCSAHQLSFCSTTGDWWMDEINLMTLLVILPNKQGNKSTETLWVTLSSITSSCTGCVLDLYCRLVETICLTHLEQQTMSSLTWKVLSFYNQVVCSWW